MKTEDYRQLKDGDYLSSFKHINEHIQQTHGILTSFASLEYPITADSDGLEIKLNEEMNKETSLFVLLHFFGHIVQWNTSEELRKFALIDFGPNSMNEKVLAKIQKYEQDASRYGVKLLHNAGIFTLDQWLSDWFAADWTYLQKLYATGGEPDPFTVKDRFMTYGAQLLTPLEIPEFTLKRGQSRYAF